MKNGEMHEILELLVDFANVFALSERRKTPMISNETYTYDFQSHTYAVHKHKCYLLNELS